MLIVCPNCATSYEVNAASLGPTGRSVRCIRCAHVWFAANTAALAAIAKAHRADLAAMSAASADGNTQPADASEAAGPGVSVSETVDEGFTAAPPSPPAAPPDRPAATSAESSAPHGDGAAAAEPVLSISDAPPLAPVDPAAGALPDDPIVGEDIETVAARRAALEASRRRFRWPLSRWPTAVLVLLTLNAALIGFRVQVVQRLPQTATLYAAIGLPVNLRGLLFSNVTTEKEANEGVQVLVVEGTIANTTAQLAEVPRLRFAVRDEHGHEIYTWTARPPRNELAPGATLAFRSRLASPPPEAHDVLVRFFNRRDLIDTSE
jgi:predicted Zn finger-like uncharacterized protein